jgi:Ca-activated chloride channel family protein
MRKPVSSLILLLIVSLLLVGAGDKKAAPVPENLPQKYKDFLQEVALLITPEERQAFLELKEDYQRDAFIERFWRARDPYPGTARNEFRDKWEGRIQYAKTHFEHMDGDRAKYLLLNGPPTALVVPRCRSVLWPTQIWFYKGSDKVRDTFALIFYKRYGMGRYILWQPFDGLRSLIQFASPSASTQQLLSELNSCIDRDAVLGAINLIQSRGALDYTMLLNKLSEPGLGAHSGEWVSGFSTYSTEIPPDAPTIDADLSISYPGRHQQRTLVQGVIGIPVSEVEPTTLGEATTYNFGLTGEVLLGPKLFENFRYQFQIPAKRVEGERIPLVFERALRPGKYHLLLRVADLDENSYYRVERDIDVPALEGPAGAVPANPEMERLLKEANAAILSGDTTIQIVPPQGELLTGQVRIDTLTTGSDIAQVAFQLDGHTLLKKTRPPFSVELDMGELPRMHDLVVVAYDAEGHVLARDERLLNAGAHRFSIRLVDPQPGKSYERSLRAVAKVSVPEGGAVQRVEFYLNEDKVATLFQPPWEQPILLRQPGQAGYVRAVAYQPDGNSTEDVVFINAPGVTAQLKVQFVELYIAAVDRDHHPVSGLQENDFTILEDGVPQKPTRFDVVSNLPIHAALMLDVSASMKPNLETAQHAALSFLQDVVTPKDRAAVITFNDQPQLTARFTNDMERLSAGLAGLHAERGTALYDSLIYALYYFNGIKGQRALVLLTDGKDESSRFHFDDALEYCRRSGVAIYTIGLGIGERGARRKLERLANETGGRAFNLDSIDQLPEIYETIQRELRSRYYLAYQSTNASDDEKFRSIEVKVDKPGVEAQTIRGYYP